jgi:hypothetical protein
MPAAAAQSTCKVNGILKCTSCVADGVLSYKRLLANVNADTIQILSVALIACPAYPLINCSL